MRYIIECKTRGEKAWSDWESLCDELLERDEVLEFFKGCDPEDDSWTQFRARPHPEFGFEVLTPERTYAKEERLVLSRDMPREVHELNDRVLRTLGI